MIGAAAPVSPANMQRLREIWGDEIVDARLADRTIVPENEQEGVQHENSNSKNR